MDVVEQDRNNLMDKMKTIENQRDDLLRKGRVVESERNDFLRNNKLMEMQRDDLENRCAMLQKTNTTLNSRVGNLDIFCVLNSSGSVEAVCPRAWSAGLEIWRSQFHSPHPAASWIYYW